MRERRPPRYQGSVTTWKDEQGYGFITPNGGGSAVFLHVSAMGGGGRPAQGDVVTYHLSANDKGQPRAAHVMFVDAGAGQSPARPGRAMLTALLCAAILALCVVKSRLPAWIAGMLACVNLLTFLAYAADKAAARGGRRRTPEDTLHVLGLIGGWPAALVAQQLFRHKTRKQSFRRAFRLTVVLNCALLAWLVSHWGVAWLRLHGLG